MPDAGSAPRPRSQDEAERRAGLRVPVLLGVEIRAMDDTPGVVGWRPHPDGGRVLETTTEDLAVGGLSFTAPADVELGTRLELLLETPGHDLALTGAVVHSTTNPAGTSVGVRFDELHRSIVAQLERLVAGYRERLVPRVSIGFRAVCWIGPQVLDGTTRDCSPGALTLTLPEAVPAGAPVATALYFGDENITLRGRVASCRATLSGREWSAVVLIEDASPVIAARWRAVLDARRIGR
jgi:PilZ domain-containing protein